MKIFNIFRWSKFFGTVVLLGFIFIFPISNVNAYPALQLYIDGSTYDPETDSWVTTSQVFDLWIIGDVGPVGTIYEIKLTTSFFGDSGTISFMPKTTSLVTDPSVPGFDPDDTIIIDGITYPRSGTGDHPKLPDHGIFNDPELNYWTDYYLGDFTLTDSPVGDFMTSFPSTFDSLGQINVYEVTVSGWERVHFDAYDHYIINGNKVKYVFAPFSHNSEHDIPEPSTISLLAVGGILLGLSTFARRWRRPKL